MSIMLVTSGPWSSSTAVLSDVGSGPIEVCTNKVRHLFGRDLLRFQWYSEL